MFKAEDFSVGYWITTYNSSKVRVVTEVKDKCVHADGIWYFSEIEEIRRAPEPERDLKKMITNSLSGNFKDCIVCASDLERILFVSEKSKEDLKKALAELIDDGTISIRTTGGYFIPEKLLEDQIFNVLEGASGEGRCLNDLLERAGVVRYDLGLYDLENAVGSLLSEDKITFGFIEDEIYFRRK